MRIAREEAATRLRRDYGVRSGSKIYTTILHVSRSGMTRTIKASVSYKGEVFDVSHLVAAATGMRYDRDRGGVVVGGCGMDMTFHLVYSLSRALFPKGHRCNGIDSGARRCPSNDHSNDWGSSARMADAELEAEGLSWEDGDYVARRSELADQIREREGLTYRKGRKHADGGYALTRVSL